MTCFRPFLSWRDSNTFDCQCVYRYTRQPATNPLLTFRTRFSTCVFFPSFEKLAALCRRNESPSLVNVTTVCLHHYQRRTPYQGDEINKHSKLHTDHQHSIHLTTPIQYRYIFIELTSISSAYFETKSSPGRPSSSTTSPTPLVRRRPGISVYGSAFPAPRFAASWNSFSVSFSSVVSGSDKDDRSSSEMPQPLRQK